MYQVVSINEFGDEVFTIEAFTTLEEAQVMVATLQDSHGHGEEHWVIRTITLN